MTLVRSSPSGRNVDVATGEEDAGVQASWAIDPLVGNDNAAGTPAAPLRTMEEFNLRMQGVTVHVAQTLQLVGNVVDASLSLNGTRYTAGSTLTVSGTLTTLGTAQVVSTSAVGTGWQVTTTGIDWTTIATSAVGRFSTGQACAISEIVDANNVIIGMIAAPGLTTTSVAPTNGSTLTVSSRSRMWPIQVNAFGQGSLTAQQLIIQFVSFDAAGVSAGFVFQGGLRVQLYACEINNHNTIAVNTPLNVRVSKFTITATMGWLAGANSAITVGCVVGGAGSTLFNINSGLIQHQTMLMTGARLSCNNASMIAGGVHIRNTAGPVLISGNGYINVISGSITGSVGNTGIGIDVPFGKISYIGGAQKPTVAGASDTRVGGTARTYAQIPYTALDATTPTNLVGNGSAIVQE